MIIGEINLYFYHEEILEIIIELKTLPSGEYKKSLF